MGKPAAAYLILIITFTVALAAQDKSPQKIPELLPREQEIQLALSAAPARLRQGAGVFVLEKNGFVKARDTKNGFTCIVNRDHPLNQKPTCYDAEGTATILPKVVRVGELLMQGKPLTEIRSEIKKDFETGKFISPRRPGVAYMLSGDIKNFNAQTGKVDSFPPHVMFYAPNLTNDDIGSDGNFNPGMPSIAYQGPKVSWSSSFLIQNREPKNTSTTSDFRSSPADPRRRRKGALDGSDWREDRGCGRKFGHRPGCGK